MSLLEWKPIEVKPEFFGMCALRIQTEFTDADGRMHVAHELLVGQALDSKFAFTPGYDWHCLDKYFITHYLELPLIEGLDKYFRDIAERAK